MFRLVFYIMSKINMIYELCADLNSTYWSWGTFRLHLSVLVCWNRDKPSKQQANQTFLKVNIEVMTSPLHGWIFASS